MNDDKKPGSASEQVSPDYRAKCLDWAIKLHNVGDKSKDVLDTAKQFHAYVYEGKLAPANCC